MPLAILCYLLANTAYFFVLPLHTIENTNTVAVQFGSKVFGPVGSLVLALIVSASCFGALNATTFTSGRLVYVAGKEGYIPAFFGQIGFGFGSSEPTTNRVRRRSWLTKALSRLLGESSGVFFTPMPALVLNFLLTTAYILAGEFASLFTFYGVAGYSFYFLTVLGLIVLRIKEPYLERPYKTWISTPIIFCCVSLFLLSRAVVARPKGTVGVLAFVALGVPVWWWRIGRERRREGKPREREGVGYGRWKFWRRWWRRR